MSSRHQRLVDDDAAIPQPVWFAQQLRWCTGPQGIWTWERLTDLAVQMYWQNKAKGRAA